MTRSASLEIHVIDVSHGDAVLVVNRDLAALAAAITAKVGAAKLPADPIDHVPFAVANDVSLAGTVKKALLVDAGNDSFGNDVVEYLELHGVVTKGTPSAPNLAVVGSHFHADHVAGLRYVFRELDVPVVTAKAKKQKTTKQRYLPGSVYFPVTHKNVNDTSKDLVASVKTAGTASSPTTLTFVKPGGLDAAGQQLSIDLGKGVDDIPIRAFAMAASMGVYNGPGLPKAITGKTKKPDDNDYSIVLVVEYGSFRCLLGGDIGGNGGADGGNDGANVDPTKKKYFSASHADVETTLGAALRQWLPATAANARVKGKPKYPSDGYCTVLKADHHGSASSVDVNFLAAVRPILFVASAGARVKYHGHPTQAVLNRVTKATTSSWFEAKATGATTPNSIQAVCLTESVTKYKGKAVTTDPYTARVLGDVVVRPVDESVAAVQDAAGAATVDLEVQVYGTGIQTHLFDTTTVLRPVETGAVAPYPIKPVYYTDAH